MEHLIGSEHGMQAVTGFCVLLAINVILTVGKYLIKLFEKKSDKNEQSIKDFHKKIETMNSQVAKTEGQLERMVSIISSYMETTIRFSEKIGSVEKQLTNVMEKMESVDDKFSEISKYDDDMRKFSSAIKWLAGNRWEELRQQILDDDDFRS